MSYQSKLLAGGTAVLHVGAGEVHGADVLSAARTVQRLARTRRITHIAVDFTAVTLLNASAGQLRDIATANLGTARRAPGGKLAIAASQDHVFGLVRMWSVFVEGIDWQIHMSRELAPAKEWLGISLDTDGATPFAALPESEE